MRHVRERLNETDNNEFSRDLYNDTNNPNGNKLRTYRTYKTEVKTERYLTIQIPRNVRRTVALFRSGSLPLSIETGRYTRPRKPVEERICRLCDTNCVECEKHFLMACPLYDDFRYELFTKARSMIVDFEILDLDSKFSQIMSCDAIQTTLSYTIFNSFQRRKLFI